MNKYHEANRRGWNAISQGWQAQVESRGIWRHCHRDPQLILAKQELKWLTEVADRTVCVLGSGDNLAVFALAGLRAKVTSVDISQVQLDIAAKRATELKLDVRFLCADVTDLEMLDDNLFDFVYTGGHVAVWVSDLKRYYTEACRILKPDGLFIVNEYHPFRRIWKEEADKLELESSYFYRGPFEYDRSEDHETSEPGPLLSYEFNWTVSDYVTAMLNVGCDLLALEEFGDGVSDWEQAPLEGLPLSLLLIGRKKK